MATTSLTDAKTHLSDYVTSAEESHERTTITRNGRPAAVLMSCEDLDSLMATLELLSDPEAIADIEESKINAEHGLAYSSDEVWDGEHAYSDEEADRRLVARMGREACDAARSAVRADLLAHPDANVRERAKDYG
jgi:antitoxin YefM